MMKLNSKTKTRLSKALYVAVSITTALSMSGAALLAPVSSSASVTINDGDIFRASNDYKVYIAKYVGSKSFKRWFVGPQMFTFYKHLGFAKVKVVDPSVAASFTESKLIRVDGDQKVWFVGNAVAGQGADKQWVPDLATFQAAGFDWDGVYVINSAEGNWYNMGMNFSSVSNPNPNPSSTVTPAVGSISASLAADNPGASVLASGSDYNQVLKLNFMGPASGTALVSGVTLTKSGYLGNTNITTVSAWDGSGNRLGPIMTSLTSDGKVTLSFGSNPLPVPAGSSASLTFAIGIASTVTSGTVSFGVMSASDIMANASVGGAFPLNGNTFSITSGSNSLAAYTIAAQTAGGASSSTASGNVDVGTLQQQIG